jgi:type II secretory pathway pseudopilin PulG
MPDCTSRRAFSLIEVVVVIGIVMVLIGLLSPMLRGTWSAAQGSKHLVLVQQHAVLVDQFLQSNKDIYPLHGVNVGEA